MTNHSGGIIPPNDTLVSHASQYPRKYLYRFIHRGKTTLIPARTYVVARLKSIAIHRMTRNAKKWGRG
jgi:hypothetical protein